MMIIKEGMDIWYKPTMEHGSVCAINGDTFKVEWDEGTTSQEFSLELGDFLFLVDVEQYQRALRDKVSEDKPKIYDPVNPKHYDLFPEYGIQVRELMQVLCEKLDKKGYSGFLASDYVQAMQYFMRWFEKGGAEDISKGVWYMNKILEQLNNKENL